MPKMPFLNLLPRSESAMNNYILLFHLQTKCLRGIRGLLKITRTSPLTAHVLVQIPQIIHNWKFRLSQIKTWLILNKMVNPMNDTWRSNYHSKSLRGKCRFVESRKGSTLHILIENERIRLCICHIVEQQYLCAFPGSFYSF